MSDRPIECSYCKKPVKTVYKEIYDHSKLETEMCQDCPILQQKLHGQVRKEEIETFESEKLQCSHCGTSLESIKMGNPLGCSQCYSQFEPSLVKELNLRGKISPRFKQKAKAKLQPLHMGRSPETSYAFTNASRLIGLNEALEEALKKENYEQAAWLRDQIKHLKEQSSEGKN